MLRPSRRRSFYLVVSRERDDQSAWSWEIRRKRKPLGIRLREGGFDSHQAAQAAGRAALEDLLNGLAMDIDMRLPL